MKERYGGWFYVILVVSYLFFYLILSFDDI